MRRLFLALFLVIIIGFVLVNYFLGQTKIGHVINGYILHNEKVLKQTNGHTNILLLGIGGGTHDGPDLTDTIIFASIDNSTHKVSLVSIPRDLWINDLQAKINTIYAVSEEKNQGTGLQVTKTALGKILGQPIHYGFRIDFAGFVKAVDQVGGLDINVDRAFDDYAYPIEGKEDDPCGHTNQEVQDLSSQIASGSASESDAFPCRYKHLHFDAGQQHMDGQTALEYVRSRHALGPEGSDFARSRRQAKIIAAFKQKIFSVQTLLDPAKVMSLYNILKESIDTDITEDDIGILLHEAQDFKNAGIESTVLDFGDQSQNRYGLLVNPPVGPDYNNEWVLIPRAGNGNYSEISQYISCFITVNNCVITKDAVVTITPTISPKPSE